MSKIVLIAGSFDCISKKEVNLIKEGLKLSIGGRLVVLLYGDYQCYQIYGKFPAQSYLLRENNLQYFVGKMNIIIREETLKDINKTLGSEDILFVHYGDDKDFAGREDLKDAGVPIKFIKPFNK